MSYQCHVAYYQTYMSDLYLRRQFYWSHGSCAALKVEKHRPENETFKTLLQRDKENDKHGLKYYYKRTLYCGMEKDTVYGNNIKNTKGLLEHSIQILVFIE